MIVRDFDVVRISGLPTKADSILIVDPDAVLSLSIATEPLEAVPGGNRQFAKIADAVDLRELPPGDGPQSYWAGCASRSRGGPIEHVLGALLRKGRYHGSYYDAERIRAHNDQGGPLNSEISRFPLGKMPTPQDVCALKTGATLSLAGVRIRR
jgi:hypothetical protein